MTETIDTTQWLPRTSPVVNAYRIAQGNIDGHVVDGRIASLRVVERTIAHILIAEGFLEEYHLSYGLDLIELRNALYGLLNAKTSAFMFMRGDSSLKRNHAEQVYNQVMQDITLPAYRIIEHACNELARNEMHIAEKEVYRKCFEALERSMDSALEKLREDLEKGVA